MMRSALTVAAHEVRDLVRSPVLVALWLALVGLLVHAVHAGAAHNAAEREDLARVAELDTARLAENAERHTRGLEDGAGFAERLYADPHWIGLRYGARHAVLPTLRAGALASDDDPLAVDAVLVTSGPLDLAKGATTTRNPTLLALGLVDPAFVLAWVVPLVIVAFAFGLLSEERERGTAVALFAAPVTVGAVLLGKLAPRFVLLAVPTATAAFVAASDGQDPDAFVRGALAAGAVALFVLVWLLAAAAFDLGRSSSATTALALAGAWLVAAVGLPAATEAAWAFVDDAPSAATQVAIEREARHLADTEKDAVLDAFMADHPELAARADEGAVASYKRAVWAQTERITALTAPLAAEREAAAQRRARFFANAGVLSPVTALERALDVVAGRDDARRRAFEARVREHHAAWQAWFLERSLEGSAIEPDALADAPRFEWVEPDGRALLASGRPALVALGLQALLLLSWIVARRGRFAVLLRSS